MDKNILLLEPGYSTKFPPLGLMKIAYYHDFVRNDFVWFAKGKVPKQLSDSVKVDMKSTNMSKSTFKHDIQLIESKLRHLSENPTDWDRVYVTTMFTFEWKKTIETINYAINLVGSPEKVYVGGICASLMPTQIANATGIVPFTGLLQTSTQIGYNDDYPIETSIMHYGILDHVQTCYPDAYFGYTTRGCGMNCEFCAVRKLEPTYEARVSISHQIERASQLFGTRKNLILMDNNVLKSPKLEEIISEIVDLGFHRHSKRFVDFNQGLDLNLITERTAKLLGQIELKPARIAFDHIADAERYEKAAKLIMKYGPTELSNYMLYNADNFAGKGRVYRADRPEDLYERLRINVQLKDKLSERYGKASVYSFPMKYVPLDATDRAYIGPEWDRKHLRAIQVMLNPAQGKGVSGRSFFEASFGQTLDEFRLFCLMPERYLLTRGEVSKSPKNYTNSKAEARIKEKKIGDLKRAEWLRLYDSMSETQKSSFKKIISTNKFSWKSLLRLPDPLLKKIYSHYFDTPTKALNLIQKLAENRAADDLELVKQYYFKEFSLIGKEICELVARPSTPKQQIQVLLQQAYHEIIDLWCNSGFVEHYLVGIFQNLPNPPVAAAKIKVIHALSAFGAFGRDDIEKIRCDLHSYDSAKLAEQIEDKLDQLNEILDSQQFSGNGQKLVSAVKEYFSRQLSLDEHGWDNYDWD